MAADIESARLTPLAGVAFEEFRSTLNTPLPESTRGLLAREETAGMTTRFSGPPSLPWRPIAVWVQTHGRVGPDGHQAVGCRPNCAIATAL